MGMEEDKWDRFLHIRTTGRDDSQADQYRYPYEPTPYSVLERLANAGYIRKGNTVLDYGCGKGRADFFLSWQTRCRSIGVEYDRRMLEKAVTNQKTAVQSDRTEFVLADAEHFAVPDKVDRIYFFNPFSLEILLFFYYPSDEYVSYLMTVDELDFLDEIDCRDLFPDGDVRERILVFACGQRAAE